MNMKDTLITPLLLSQEQALAAAGWSLAWESDGWVRTTHPSLGQTQATFPAKSRGLKFLIARVNKIHAANNLPAIEVHHETTISV